MLLVGRNYSITNENYRFGFNGYENTDELLGDNIAIDFGARVYDSRLGRFFSIDPRSGEYPWQTPFAYFSNSPIAIVDVAGMGGPTYWIDEMADGGGESNFHTIKSGETLSEIAIKYQVSVDELVLWNNIEDKNKINSGDRLYLNDPRPIEMVTESNGDSQSNSNETGSILTKGLASFGTFGTIGETSASTFRITNGVKGNISPKIYFPTKKVPHGWTGGSKAGITTYKVATVGKVATVTTAVVSTGVDLVGVYNYYNNPDAALVTTPTKASINAGMTAYGIWVNPPAAAGYFLLDAFYPGGFEGAMKDNAEIQNMTNEIFVPEVGKPHFYVLPWGAQKL